MSLLYPSYLWGLLGLAIPIAIHLWSKKEGRIIKIGSIQLLDKGNTKKASSIQINEIFLLILRLLLISLLVFIMAGAKWKEKSTRVPLVYLIEPALLSDAQIREALDTISEQKVFLLKKGFPVWDREKMQKKQSKTPNYWQLAQDFENLNADSLVVYSRALEQGIHGKRPSIDQNINWVILNPETLNNEPFLAINRIDSIEIVGVTSDSDQLLLEKENFDKASGNFQVKSDSLSLNRSGKRFQLPLFNVDTLRVQVSASDSFIAEEKYLTSALNALSIYLKRPFQIFSSKDSIRENLNLIIWLHEDSINLSNVPVLTYNEDNFAKKLIVGTKNPNVFNLTQKLNSENIISGHLPEQLLTIINLNPDFEERIKDYDLRNLSNSELKTRINRDRKDVNRAQLLDLTLWFWLVFIIIFLSERIISFYRKQ